MTRGSLYICLVSVHGLIRGNNPELGRDSDTGGQVLYVLELASALIAMPEVARVDIVTRLIDDPRLSPDYARKCEVLGPKVRILRFRAGGLSYLHKEELWDCLDAFGDEMARHFRASNHMPDLLHSHYADAGYICSRLASQLNIALVHTGHSLGRVKRRRLLAQGLCSDLVDRRYRMRTRIRAEEKTLASAARVIASTHQEIDDQYSLYNFYRPEVMQVIPPGTDLSKFSPPLKDEWDTPIGCSLKRFLADPSKPMILALSRADPRKNIAALLHAYGSNPYLRESANLVVVIGNRDQLSQLQTDAQQVMLELLELVDRYDLYGHIAYPKRHQPEDVPVLYRLAAASRGVFVNPALTEPFGLTLLEAAASGLPVVATEDGGAADIVANCGNGLLVDPLNPTDIAGTLRTMLSDQRRWQSYADQGLQGVRKTYAWQAHAQQYLAMVRTVLDENPRPVRAVPDIVRASRYIDRALFTDLNRSLLGDERALRHLIGYIRANRARMKFGICTGLTRDSAMRLMRRFRIPEPDVLISASGTEIFYAPKLTVDVSWTSHIEKRWTPGQVKRILQDVNGLELRSSRQQTDYKISYLCHPGLSLSVDQISERLYREDQSVNVIYSHGKFLNIIPLNASKGLAMRHAVARFDIALENTLAIGTSAADEDMIRGNVMAAIVSRPARHELEPINTDGSVYLSKKQHAAGILEAIEHYNFIGQSCALHADSELVY